MESVLIFWFILAKYGVKTSPCNIVRNLTIIIWCQRCKWWYNDLTIAIALTKNNQPRYMEILEVAMMPNVPSLPKTPTQWFFCFFCSCFCSFTFCFMSPPPFPLLLLCFCLLFYYSNYFPPLSHPHLPFFSFYVKSLHHVFFSSLPSHWSVVTNTIFHFSIVLYV